MVGFGDLPLPDDTRLHLVRSARSAVPARRRPAPLRSGGGRWHLRDPRRARACVRRRGARQCGGDCRGTRRMSLIGTLIDKLLTKGSITLKTPGKPPHTYGPGGGKHLTVRFTDRKVGFDIAKNPRL